MPSSGLIRQVMDSPTDLSVIAPQTFSSTYRWFNPRSQENGGALGDHQRLYLVAWKVPRRIRIDGLQFDLTGAAPQATDTFFVGLYDSTSRQREAQIVPNNLKVSESITGITTAGSKSVLFTPVTLQPGIYFLAYLNTVTTQITVRSAIITRGANPWQFLWAGTGGTGSTAGFASGNDATGVWLLTGQTSLPSNASLANSAGNTSGLNVGPWMSVRIAWA